MASPLAAAARQATRELELEWATEEERQAELTEAERYARDPLAWLNSGQLWIASPFREGLSREQIEAICRGKDRKLYPMRLALYPGQEQTVAGWVDLPTLKQNGELHFQNLLIEKSRQIGETWLFAALLGWALHYHRVSGLAISRKLVLIDNGGERANVESLFGRVRYIETRLGSTRGLPSHPEQRKALPGCDTRLAFRRMPSMIENPATGAYVMGASQEDNPARGSTLDFVLADEAAFLEHGESVYAAIDEACPGGKALLSTVNGEGNFHARLAKERPSGWTYLRLHWSDHPVYRLGLHVAGADEGCELCAGNRTDTRWDATDPKAHRYPGRPTSWAYDARVIGKTDEQVANELDIDRERSKPGRVFPEFSAAVHVVEEGVAYEPELYHKLELALDSGLDVASVLVFQDAPSELRLIGIMERGSLLGSSGVAANVARDLRTYLAELGVEERLLTPQWTRRMYAVSDPSDHNPQTATGISYVSEMARMGFRFSKPASYFTNRQGPSIAAVKRLFDGWPKPFRICGVHCQAFVEHARENTFRLSPDGRVLGLADDLHNHAMRAFAYYAIAKYPPPDEPDPMEFEPDPSVVDRARDGVLDAGVYYDMKL